MEMQRLTDLKVWQRGHALVLEVYKLTRTFPADERFGLTSQLRRAVLSVPTNIAEGTKRQSSHDYARFLNIAEGSLVETEYLPMVAIDLGNCSCEGTADTLKEVREIASMLHALRVKVEQQVLNLMKTAA
jgi:four helix bundle protein